MIAGPRVRIDDRKSFQRLKTTLLRRLVDAVDLSRTPALGEKELREQLQALAAHVCSRDPANLPSEVRQAMVREIMDEIYGFGPLEPLLADPAVGDVLVNGPDSVRVERNGVWETTDVRFADAAHLLRLIHRLVGEAGQRIDERLPLVEIQLPDGSRATAVIPPLAAGGPTLAIRRGPKKAIGLDELVRRGTLAQEMADFLAAAVHGRLNLLISGGASAGKTTLLGALGGLIPSNERIVTIEEAAELKLEQPDVVALHATAAVQGRRNLQSLRDLVRDSVRLRPDRVLLGDVRGPEVFELFEAMRSGHDGSMCTVHANDTRDALDRIELLLASSETRLPLPAIRASIGSAVQVLIQISRLSSGERKVTRISEMWGAYDGEYQIEDLFVYRMAGCDENGRLLGAFYSTGTEPASLARLASQGIELSPEIFLPRELAGETLFIQKVERS